MGSTERSGAVEVFALVCCGAALNFCIFDDGSEKLRKVLGVQWVYAPCFCATGESHASSPEKRVKTLVLLWTPNPLSIETAPPQVKNPKSSCRKLRYPNLEGTGSSLTTPCAGLGAANSDPGHPLFSNVTSTCENTKF